MFYRRAFGLSSALIAAIAALSMPVLPSFSGYRPARGGAKRRNRTGHTYPFSSKRQNERYARQIAAGQLCMAGILRGAV